MTPRTESDRQSSPPLLVAGLLVLAVSMGCTSALAYGGPGWSGREAQQPVATQAASEDG